MTSSQGYLLLLQNQIRDGALEAERLIGRPVLPEGWLEMLDRIAKPTSVSDYIPNPLRPSSRIEVRGQSFVVTEVREDMDRTQSFHAESE